MTVLASADGPAQPGLDDADPGPGGQPGRARRRAARPLEPRGRHRPGAGADGLPAGGAVRGHRLAGPRLQGGAELAGAGLLRLLRPRHAGRAGRLPLSPGPGAGAGHERQPAGAGHRPGQGAASARPLLVLGSTVAYGVRGPGLRPPGSTSPSASSTRPPTASRPRRRAGRGPRQQRAAHRRARPSPVRRGLPAALLRVHPPAAARPGAAGCCVSQWLGLLGLAPAGARRPGAPPAGDRLRPAPARRAALGGRGAHRRWAAGWWRT